ncbi:hypothetical protein E2562_011306 [Oryza meyeriana var. granulata]|uniref:non-specific serine/threonine protein kinase n=1 Tax=Oryza meyeriana var. granulata TaxID=110450 RepID=A0A6G1BU94_9ORYZ|nr:hypothetical protein E2562_011306 [Oryza meyeriana var. granulata]
MGSSGCSEIVELVDETKDARPGGVTHLRVRVKPVGQEHGARSCSVEDDLDRLIRSINVRTSARASGQTSTDRRLIALGKSPISSSEIVESVSLKQALRKMCISQASEMAAMKRMSKPTVVSNAPEAGAIKKLYASVVVQTNVEQDEKNKLGEVCVLPEKDVISSSVKSTEAKNKVRNKSPAKKNVRSASPTATKVQKTRIQDVISNKSSEASEDPPAGPAVAKQKKGKSKTSSSPRAVPVGGSRLVFRSKTSTKKKVKPEPAAAVVSHKPCEAKGSNSHANKKDEALQDEPRTPAPINKKAVVSSISADGADCGTKGCGVGGIHGSKPESCIDPLCIQPSWANSSCFTPRLVSSTPSRARRTRGEPLKKPSLPQLVVEPTDARSNSFVGTHEYLAPEIIRGDGHGSSVDWWTLGIFLYELLYGRTPFRGPGNEETLTNVISQGLKFPDNPAVSFHARDLIRGLLVKDPEYRLGSTKGAAEIKRHPFFEGLNWALIRWTAPPETPKSFDAASLTTARKKKEGKCLEFRLNGDDIEFELF